jgi:hypothetical protein
VFFIHSLRLSNQNMKRIDRTNKIHKFLKRCLKIES